MLGTTEQNRSVFLESPIAWGGVGLLGGAVAVVWSLKAMFFVAAFVFLIAILRTRFFKGKSLLKEVTGTIGLTAAMCSILFGLWTVTPKPKEPPSAEEIADAVIKKERTDIPKESAPPPQPSIPPPRKTQYPSRSTSSAGPKPSKPTQTETTSPSPSPVPQSANLIVSQKPSVSTREDAPDKTEHCCPVRSPIDSTGCRGRVSRCRSRRPEVPVKWAFSRRA